MTTTNPIIATKPYSSHPDDSHLTVVLHKNFKGEYVTHVHNSEDGGFYWGHYFSDLESAMKDFHKRGESYVEN